MKSERVLTLGRFRPADHKLLIINALGFVPRCNTGAGPLCELTSQHDEGGMTVFSDCCPNTGQAADHRDLRRGPFHGVPLYRLTADHASKA